MILIKLKLKRDIVPPHLLQSLCNPPEFGIQNLLCFCEFLAFESAKLTVINIPFIAHGPDQELVVEEVHPTSSGFRVCPCVLQKPEKPAKLRHKVAAQVDQA